MARFVTDSGDLNTEKFTYCYLRINWPANLPDNRDSRTLTQPHRAVEMYVN